MGFFKNISKEVKASEPRSEKWLESTDDLDKIIQESYNKPVAIFKHSSRCGISKVVQNRTISNWNTLESNVDIYFLDLLRFRSLSNYISEIFHVEHQSPQLIILKDGKSIYDRSHNSIDVDSINTELVKP
ncbi:MAG: bacillithiol system redox-active protein YtxJ [Chitinophagales bacterium]|nr:bacillithiol system redox-active protein YtxJ [Chitinophagales bacterium]